jgi:hypothetical protein
MFLDDMKSTYCGEATIKLCAVSVAKSAIVAPRKAAPFLTLFTGFLKTEVAAHAPT